MKVTYPKLALRLCLLICLGLSLPSCENRQARLSLADIASYLQDSPDSARAALEAIDSSSLNTKALRADYALLYSAALYKTYADTTDLGIISPAVDFYGRKGADPDKKLKTYYYEGVTYYNRGEYDRAIVSLSRAEELVPEVTDRLYVGLLYSMISYTYNKTRNFIEEYKYINLAMDVFTALGASKYYYTTLLSVGEALANLLRYDEAEDIYKDMLRDPLTPASLINDIKEDYALMLMSHHFSDPQAALTLYKEVLAAGNGLRNINLWASYACALSYCGYPEESEEVFDQLYSMPTKRYTTIDSWKSAAYYNEGRYKESLIFLQKSIAYYDSLVNVSVSQAATRAQRDYFVTQSNQLRLEKENDRMTLSAIIVGLLLVSLLLYFLYRSRSERLEREKVRMADIAENMKKRLRESEEVRALEKVSLDGLVSEKETEISSLRKEIDTKEEILANLRNEYARMYKTQFKYLGDLCETFLLANDRKDSQRIVYDKVRDMLKNLSGDSAGQKRFERMIDKSLDNLMKHFRDDFPDYSDEDYRFVSYIFVGFDATTLCIIFNMPSVAAVYMRKSRVKKAILESNSEFKDNYLLMLT